MLAGLMFSGSPVAKPENSTHRQSLGCVGKHNIPVTEKPRGATAETVEQLAQHTITQEKKMADKVDSPNSMGL
jgi:hypothetical protein